MRQRFIMPSIGGRDIACAKGANVRSLEHFLKLLNVVNDALDVHA